MNHLYLKGLAMYIDEQSVTGLYIVDFYANKKLFKKIRLQADGGGVISFYDENDNITVVAQYGSYVSANNLYRYIQIDIDSCPEGLKKFLNYPDNITNCDNGYFEIINNIDYFVDFKDSPDKDSWDNIYIDNNTYDSLNPNFQPIISPMTSTYVNNNFNEKLFNSFYLSFEDNGLTKYININEDSKFEISENLNYNSIFYLDSNNYIKYINILTGVEKFVVSVSFINIWYIGLVSTRTSGNYKVELENNKLFFTLPNNTSYYFIGTIANNTLNVNPNISTASSVSSSVICQNSNYNPFNRDLHYKLNDLNLKGIIDEPKTITLKEYNYTSTGILDNTIYCLNYSNLETPSIDILDKQSKWVGYRLNNTIFNKLNYILPILNNTIDTVYNKEIYLNNNSGIKNIKLMRSSIDGTNKVNFINNEVSYLTQWTGKNFNTNQPELLSKWHADKWYLDFTNSDLNSSTWNTAMANIFGNNGLTVLTNKSKTFWESKNKTSLSLKWTTPNIYTYVDYSYDSEEPSYSGQTSFYFGLNLYLPISFWLSLMNDWLDDIGASANYRNNYINNACTVTKSTDGNIATLTLYPRNDGVGNFLTWINQKFDTNMSNFDITFNFTMLEWKSTQYIEIPFNLNDYNVNDMYFDNNLWHLSNIHFTTSSTPAELKLYIDYDCRWFSKLYLG